MTKSITVLAALCLVLTVSTGAFAARGLLTGAEIKNGSLTGADIKEAIAECDSVHSIDDEIASRAVGT